MTNSPARSHLGLTGILLALLPLSACVPDDISPQALQQMRELLAEKEARTPAERRVASSLLYAMKALDGEPTLPDAANGVDTTTEGALVDLRVTSTQAVIPAIAQAGGTVLYTSPAGQRMRARIPLAQIGALAEAPAVLSIGPASRVRVDGQALTSASQPIQGSLTSQGLVSHAANVVQSTYGVDGSGVRVGVLSDSAESTSFLISTGDLPANTTIVQDIIGLPGSSEGSAMMEIVHDLAPGAQLFFASGFNGPASFADNIRTLRNAYACDVIVDNLEYTAADPPFQDGVIAQAVNDVTASGALYLSAAGNQGNLTSGTSSVWEDDFVSAGTNSLLPGYTLHSFGSQSFNRLLVTTGEVLLFWSDPLGGSSNDYDLFVLNAAGTAVLASSTDIQSGSQDPVEEIFSGSGFPANARIVIATKAGAAPRALHLEAFFGERLQIATMGRTRGHVAAANTIAVAPVFWNSARTGTRPFVGGPANPTEIFSSDGPRRIFFDAAGTAITPGNFLFGTNGGAVLAKPDLAAADGVTTRTPGFNPYFSTGAAAAHAAGIAALIKSANPSLTPQQIRDAMTSTALDIRDPGIDRDSGYGIPMAPAAVDAALR